MRATGTPTPTRPKTANIATAVAFIYRHPYRQNSRERQIKAGDWEKKQSEKYPLTFALKIDSIG